jgi:hypothetical protein
MVITKTKIPFFIYLHADLNNQRSITELSRMQTTATDNKGQNKRQNLQQKKQQQKEEWMS